MRSLVVLALATGCYGDGEGLSVFVPTYDYGTDVECTLDACAIATGTTIDLEVGHWASDTTTAAMPERITIEPEGIVAIDSVDDVVVVRALSPGDAAITFEETGYDGLPYVVTQQLQVRDVASVAIVPRRDGAALLDPGGVLHVLDGSTVTLRADRRGPDGEYLFGATTEAWSASPDAVLSATGTTGTQQKVELHGLGALDIRFGAGTLAVARVAASVVARARLRVAERPALVAGDGETLHVPEHASFVYVLDAFDGTGTYVAGTGAPGDVSVQGYGVRVLPIERTYAIEPGGDRLLTATVGPVTIAVTIDFP